MEAKLNFQMDNYNKIIKARSNFKKSPKERITETYSQVRLEALENLWVQFTSTHKILIEDFGSKLMQEEYIKKDIYNIAEENYIDYKTELKSSISHYDKSENQSEGDKKCTDGSKNSSLDLPKIVISSFSGKYTEWVTFRDLFISLIHSNTRLDNVQKMHYLKSYLVGEAEQLLRQIPISEANYERCWAKLVARYDNKRYLSHFILKRLLSQRNMTVESAHGLKELMDTTDDCLQGLSNLGINVKNWDIIVIHIITLKLDSASRKEWEFLVTGNNSSDELPTYEQFQEFLNNRYRSLELLDTKSSGGKYQNNTNFMNRSSFNTDSKLKTLHVNRLQCVYCSDAHKLNTCKKFTQQTVDQRRNFVQTHNVCFNCLGSNHGAKACLSQTKCKVCHRRHHTLLHPKGTDTVETNGVKADQERRNDSEVGARPNGTGGSAQDTTSLVAYYSTRHHYKQVLLATALIKAESKNGDNQILRALLDQGSQANFVTESMVQHLKLKKKPVKLHISGIGGDKHSVSKAVVTLKIKSRFHSDVSISVDAYVLKSITTFIPSRKVAAVGWTELEGIELADPQYHQPNKIDLLLGADVYSMVIQEGVKKGPTGTLVAQSTSLGWILSGVVDSTGPDLPEKTMSLHCQTNEEDELLIKFWELESDISLTKTQLLTDEEKRCEEIFVQTTTRDEEGRYIVRLPFRNDDPHCKYGDSRIIAERKLKGLEYRLRKDESLKTKYKEVIKEYLQMEHMIEVPEPDPTRNEAVYLPHHAVRREDKDTTQVRVVFNASSQGKNAVSLNDDLMVGPTIQPECRHIIMRWRLPGNCLAADIVKMYRQVKVHQADTDYQRILWRSDPQTEIKDYKLLRVTFGTACAPFLAVRALQQVSFDDGDKYPLAAERICRDFYMDDLMTGCKTIEEGIEIYIQLNTLLKRGGFTLQKWTSNNDELLERIKEIKSHKEDNKEKGKEINKENIHIKMDKIIKILGLTWARSEDNFRYVVKLPELETPLTKRKIISDIARLFDPLGWVTPCIIVAKAMIQKLWIAGIQWDEEAPREILEEWSTFRTNFNQLEHITIPRWIGTKPDDARRELHGFCDASKTAYAAVVYIRVLDSEGNIRISLVAAKSKVAPIKQVSIPRLELCGAVLLTRLMMEVAKVLEIETSYLHAWTDSTIVLAWLNSLLSSLRWKVFVANRVSEILTTLNPQQWAHVSSKENPADCASRGITPTELKDNVLWFSGPEFLKDKNIKYEKPKDINTNLEAAKVHSTVTSLEVDILMRFSTLTRLIRVVAYCRRVLKSKNPAPERKKTDYLSTKELNEALETCIRRYQAIHFEEEITALKNRDNLKRKCQLKALNPYIDENNILRVGGRLEKSLLHEKRKHPILMPKQCHLTNLIIADSHRQTLHGGTQVTLNYISSKYWILRAKQLVKAHIRKCVVCVKNTGLTNNPLMGQLPAVRVTPSRPFQSSGVDFAGPIQMRTSKGRGHKSFKGYICIFVCMATRAVHVEAVTDLTAEGFIQAFKRFVARRGHCKEVWSDNGTNFVGAASELQNLFNVEKRGILSEIAQTLANNGTTWKFIPPHAPNFGGLWEAGIKSIKFHLRRVIGTSTLTYEEMVTVLAQIEACLNSRPLSRLDTESDSDIVLTPGHFLIGEALIAAPDRNYESANVSSLRRWQYTQRMLQEFWRKWSQEYLNQFFRRYRWAKQMPQPKKGNVVLIKEDGLPPCRWLYGLVIEEHAGKDGITRVVTVKTKNSVIKRPASKICILPITE